MTERIDGWMDGWMYVHVLPPAFSFSFSRRIQDCPVLQPRKN